MTRIKALSAVVLLAGSLASAPAFASDWGSALDGGSSGSDSSSGSSSGCMVMAASNAALGRRLAGIDATKVNVNSFFNGANSCIGSDLLKNIDLSSSIPDLSGLLSSSLTNLVTKALNAAKSQVCSLVQDEAQGVVSRLNSELGQYQSSIGNNLSDVLGQNSYISVPGIDGYGEYTMTTPSVSDLVGSKTVSVNAQDIANEVSDDVSSAENNKSQQYTLEKVTTGRKHHRHTSWEEVLK